MPSSLSSLLADKLGLSEEHAHTLLERLAEAIRDHADETGVHVSGLGTFRRHEGTLTFDPDDALARRVNQRFEGLPSEAASEPLASDAPAGPSLSPTATTAALLGPRLSQSRPDTLPKNASLHVIDGPPPGPPAVWAPRTDGGAASSSTPVPSSSSKEEASPSETADTSDRRPTRPSRDRSTGARIVAAVLVALFLFGAGWFILGQQGVVPSPESALVTQSDAPATAGSEETSTDAPAPADTNDTTSTAGDTSDASTRSSPEEPATDGRWALVVASRDSRAAAEMQADTYRSSLSNEGLPVKIRMDTTKTAGHTTETADASQKEDMNYMVRYRVVVGELPSREDALAAMDTYQSQLPEGVWLLRLE